jgi:hypothetical protein
MRALIDYSMPWEASFLKSEREISMESNKQDSIDGGRDAFFVMEAILSRNTKSA